MVNRRKSYSRIRLLRCYALCRVIRSFFLALLGLTAERVGRTTDAPATAVQDMGVDHRRADILVADVAASRRACGILPADPENYVALLGRV